MKEKTVYLVLTILGAVLPLSYFVPFLLQYGFNTTLFFEQIMINNISRFFGMDVLISGIVTIFFIIYESHRLKIAKGLWCLFGLCFGVSVALPLFLYVRQCHQQNLAL